MLKQPEAVPLPKKTPSPMDEDEIRGRKHMKAVEMNRVIWKHVMQRKRSEMSNEEQLR